MSACCGGDEGGGEKERKVMGWSAKSVTERRVVDDPHRRKPLTVRFTTETTPKAIKKLILIDYIKKIKLGDFIFLYP